MLRTAPPVPRPVRASKDGAMAKPLFAYLLPYLTRAGFTDLVAVWSPGGNGEELLVEGRLP